jgi:hypothetical protein
VNLLLLVCLAATAWRTQPETIEVRRDTNTPVRLPDVTVAGHGYVVVPVREGLLVPADAKRTFTHRFGTYEYEGCHMRMIGLVENDHAALVTWEDLYANVDLRNGPEALATSLTAKSFRIQFLGKGDYVTIGQAYRKIARKAHANPKLAGASNVKLWSTFSRRMNEESTKEESVNVNWTFDEAAQVAEHLKKDIQIDKVLFTLGGWIKRGYDNQHPDIIPAAPECGGDAALADCSRRVRKLGYTFCLHDNYQDMYRDAPSWDESFLQKRRDGSVAKGGKWAGGRAYLTCAQKAFELAKRPQNLPSVKKLTDADAYFIDTTYAVGLQECFDLKHPLTRAGDMKWKQALSDYARDVFGIFGSECGREWAIRHADFFEGLTGVSGTYYHDKGLLTKVGGTVIPLFELVYRDCIAMYGKYGYSPERAAEYVLHHISIGRPLNYHSIPPHLYWKDSSGRQKQFDITPSVAEITPVTPRQFRISYQWLVNELPPADDWRILVHFTTASGNIEFQGDYAPPSPWTKGTARHGPFTVVVPSNRTGTFDVRIGFFHAKHHGRLWISGPQDEERRCLLGKLHVSSSGEIKFEPQPPTTPPVRGDVFVRADNGWADGLHPMDCFIKNTHEILSPLHELTATTPPTRHEFLTADRKVQRIVWGNVEALVNLGTTPYQDLPPFGFIIQSPNFVAFHAASFNGLRYDDPPLFTLRSLDDRPLNRSRRIRVFHGFGDPRLALNQKTHTVEKEAVVSAGR